MARPERTPAIVESYGRSGGDAAHARRGRLRDPRVVHASGVYHATRDDVSIIRRPHNELLRSSPWFSAEAEQAVATQVAATGAGRGSATAVTSVAARSGLMCRGRIRAVRGGYRELMRVKATCHLAGPFVCRSTLARRSNNAERAPFHRRTNW